MKYQYFIHDARAPNKRLDGPFSTRKKAVIASVEFNEQKIPTVIVRRLV
jgi:hypothetical protein